MDKEKLEPGMEVHYRETGEIVDIAFRAIEKVETSRPKSITGLNKGDW